MPNEVPIIAENHAIVPSPKRFVLKRTTDLAYGDESRFKVKYEKELNAAQFEAVKHTNGPALVIAGAGTGKTRTLTYRVARLVEQGVDPQSILLLTFTRRAAQEMLRRAAALLHDSKAENVAGGTFHSFANLTLRKYANLIGFTNDFSILDQGDAHDSINLLRTQMGLATARRRFPRKTTLGAMISLAVNRMTTVEDVVETDFPHFIEDLGEILRLSEAYHAYKRRSNTMDYDDLLTDLVLLLETNEKVRETLAKKYRYVMVDEYQDVNRLQARIVELLSSPSLSDEGRARANVMVVGDDAQSIYRFRGAEVENIFDFPKQYPGAAIIPLEENFRSTQPILTLTNHVISLASRRYEKELYTRNASGEIPQIVCAENEAQQSRYVVEKILEYRELGVSLKDIAVLFRSGYMSFDLELELQRANIPFQKFGGMKFIETSHVKDLTAMLRVVQNPKDAVSWYRILLLNDGEGPKTAERIVEGVLQSGLRRAAAEAEAQAEGSEPSSDTRYPIPDTRVGASVEGLFSILKFVSSDKMTPPEKVEHLIEYYKPILRKKYDDYQKREKDIETFQLITERYRSLNPLLADLSLDPPTESLSDMEEGARDDELLTLSTIHSAKGLEWNTVIITNCLDGRFPSVHAARDPEELEEERRLMYVAATRAKEHLIITYPTNLYDREAGIVLSKPSRFIDGLVDRSLAEGWVIAEE